MGINEIEYKSPVHWRYLLALEEDLLKLARYIEFTDGNYATFSIELASLLLGAASEVDVVAKQLCKKLRTGKEATNIRDYGNQIGASLPSVGRFVVELPKYGLRLNPWESWSLTHRKSPVWWKAYNNVKHQRHTHYTEANLKNTLNAVAGLFVLVLYLYRDLAEEGKLSPNPILFRPAEEFFGGTTVWDTEFLINYRLLS